jgi:hypothetical protein
MGDLMRWKILCYVKTLTAATEWHLVPAYITISEVTPVQAQVGGEQIPTLGGCKTDKRGQKS